MDYEQLTPMMRQYWEIKNRHPDAILMYRLGDFYEMFFEDAQLVSRELDLVLTGRDCGLPERAPMCGVPFHSVEGYIARLVQKGYKLAICEQMEDPSQAKGLVRRDVIRVISPGTVIESEMLDEGKNNYLCCILLEGDGAGLCFCDISTGTAEATELHGADMSGKIVNELAKYLPTEVRLSAAAAENRRLREFFNQRGTATMDVCADDEFDLMGCTEEALRHFKREYLEQTGLLTESLALRALGACLRYLREAQRSEGRGSIHSVECYSETQFMRLDASSRRNLELCETMRGREKRGSLLWVLDRTRSACGKRLLRAWLERPLVHLPRIVKRLNAVQELLEDLDARLDLQEALARMHDLERLMSRVVYQTANARELRAAAASLRLLPSIKHALREARSDYLRQLANAIDPMESLCELIELAIVEEPPHSVREGGMIRDGYLPELDELRGIERDGKGYLARIQADEQEKSGIKKLKVGYNRVFGYYIEVSNAYRELVPEHYVRKQTLAGCERYITQELKELEAKVLGAAERAVKLEYEIFSQVREALAEEYTRIRRAAGAAAALDAICSFAEVASARGYCRPEVTMGDAIQITEGRHPVVEKMLDDHPFVPNDTEISQTGCRCMVITGPNMAGKSTYMRQVALIALMAQVGSFVPAQSATIGMLDAIFTRVGASDDLASGQSTFMVEMNEVAQILKNATAKSLIIFDEIGRGTSTFDGMSIARAVLEHAANPKKLGAKTLFATHYHELTELEGSCEGVRNFAVAVKKRGDEITFLRRIVRGAADGSYGVEVAKLAGVPESVIKRAKIILKELEAHEIAKLSATGQAAVLAVDETGYSLSDLQGQALVEEIKAIDADTLTPIEALTRLYELIKRAREI
ncbi:MAG: DNA mismatch repair protein MutS [Oscillospiraceae bacterium]|nr:DNA mismatch repair protein MutS [Oscillospiraceae bacterium]